MVTVDRFRQEFGAVATCESADCIKELYESTAFTFGLALRFNKNPKLIQNANLRELAIKEIGEVGFLQIGTYGIVAVTAPSTCACLDDRKKIREIFKKHQEIAKEFQQNPLDETYPLQSIRDRALRLKVIEVEQAHLLFALDYNRHVLNKSLCFRICSLFRSISPLAKLPIRFSEYLQKNSVCLGKTSIVTNHKISAEIKGSIKSFDGQNFAAITFSLVDTDTESELGKFDITHTKGLEIPMIHDYVGQDSKSLDYPVRGILTQLAVEIFSREPAKKLKIHHDLDGTAKPVTLKKASTCTPTQFYQGKQPAFVDQKSLTWEEQIAKAPLLKGTGPILPKF